MQVSHNLQESKQKGYLFFVHCIIITVLILTFNLLVGLFSRQTEFTRKNISCINHILSRMPVKGISVDKFDTIQFCHSILCRLSTSVTFLIDTHESVRQSPLQKIRDIIMTKENICICVWCKEAASNSEYTELDGYIIRNNKLENSKMRKSWNNWW
jgi:hypothetical protein